MARDERSKDAERAAGTGEDSGDSVAVGRTLTLIVDDHELLRDGLRMMIDGEGGIEICGEAADEAAAMRLVRQFHPTLVLVDIGLKSGNGVELIKQIKSFDPLVRIVVYSMHEEHLYGERALRAGADGYVNKQEPAQTVLDAIRRVLDGKLHYSEDLTHRVMQRASSGKDVPRSPIESLSDRELDVLRLLGEGRSTRQIAEKLHLSQNTINSYRDRLKTKLDLKTGRELIRWATQWVLENS